MPSPVLVYGALEAMHAFGQELEEAVQDAVPLLWLERFGELHRRREVRALRASRDAPADALLRLRGVHRTPHRIGTRASSRSRRTGSSVAVARRRRRRADSGRIVEPARGAAHR
jgi:hypothetical protein